MRVPPSRVRYEKSHPALSIRVNQEVRQQIKDYQAKTGKSVADILKEAVGVQNGNYELAELNGHEEGFQDAKEKYCVTFPCSVCGEEIEIASDKMRQAVRGYMIKHCWGHSACKKG